MTDLKEHPSRNLATPRASLWRMTLGLAMVWGLASAQDAPAIPAATANPAAPLVEPGDNAAPGTSPTPAATPSFPVPPPISTPAPVPPPISKPADDPATPATNDSTPTPRADDEAPLPTEVPPLNNDGTAGNEAGKPAGESAQPVSPLLTDSAAVEPTIPPVLTNTKPFQLSLEVDAVYDDNIFFSSVDPVGDYIFVASPKLTLQRGDFRAKEETFAILNYNPQAIFFTSGNGDNTLDHNLKTEIQYAIARLAINLEAGYQRLSGATPDLGDRVDRDQTSAKLKLTYGWGPKLEAETSFLYTGMNYRPSELADFSEFVNETFLRYQVTARTKAALGVGIGRLEVDGFGDQDFERLLVQVMSDVGSKLTLRAKGGVEFRQTDLGDETTPIFSLAMDYKIREGTTLALEAYREVSASGGAPGENITRTGIAAKFRQKIGSRFYGGLTAGYEQLAYASTDSRSNGTAAGQAGRDDSYFFVRPSLQYELKEGRRFEVYYQHRSNDSSVDDYSFEGNQVGASVNVDF